MQMKFLDCIMSETSTCTYCNETKDISLFLKHRPKYCLECRKKYGTEYRKNNPEKFKLSPEYSSWKNAKTRSFNPNAKSADRYINKGVTMCDEWAENFSAFYEYIGPRPSLDHSLERIDNTGNYEPGNVKWATRQEQINNREVTNFADYNGAKTPLAEISRKTDVPYFTLVARLKAGKTGDDLIAPVKKAKKYLYLGELMTVSEICQTTGINDTTLLRKISAGMTVQEAVSSMKKS